MKIAFIVSKSYTVLTFRQKLIEALKKKNNEVIIIAQDNDKEEEINKLGVEFYYYNQSNRSINPFSSLKYMNYIKNILIKEKIELVFTFQAKANTFGAMAAKKAKIDKIYSMVEGAGDVFFYNTVKWKLIRFVSCRLYKSAFKKNKKVFFLNNDDLLEFKKRKLIKESQGVVINGIGVDLERFKFEQIDNFNSVVMVSRLVKTKGVYDYIDVARKVKEKYPNIHFKYLGPEGDISVDEIRRYIDSGIIDYMGMVDDVRPYLKDSFCFILPSFYREGLPMSIMEAEAMGRPIITTNNVGCRATVKDGYNGFLTECHNVDSMASKIIYLYENREECIKIGLNSRMYAEKNYNSKDINDKIISIICE